MKNKRLFYNTLVAIINQIVVLISSFIIPRMIITKYGSDVNGLITSITQFLGFIVLMDMGVGAVVKSTLYKPLSENDNVEISKIVKSAKKFYNKVGLLLIFYIFLLCCVYPMISKNSFDSSFVILLIIAISISSIAQYFVGIVNQLLLDADQKSYIQLALNIIAVILNTILCVALINWNASIHLVKIIASIVLLIKPFGMFIYVKKKYYINKDVKLTEEPIKQKKNGIAQHVAAYILSNTDIVVLTIFSSLKNVSIYNVYYLVVAGIRQVITTLTVGFDAYFGNLYAKKSKVLNKVFDEYEWVVHTIVTLLFSITAVLICPFVNVYTLNVLDANYIYPFFGILMTAAFGIYCIRLPYNTIVLAAGHYKQTQTSAIIEALINIVVSILLVNKIGLCGVAIGTLLAMTYRTFYLVFYLKDTILNREVKHFIKHLVIDIIIAITVYGTTVWLSSYSQSYIEWIILAIKVCGIAITESIIINLIFYNKYIRVLVNGLKRKKNNSN